MGGMMGSMGPMIITALLCALLAVGLVVLGAFMLGTFVRRTRTDRPLVAAPAQAQEILERRFAAGEIDEDEFFRRSAALSA